MAFRRTLSGNTMPDSWSSRKIHKRWPRGCCGSMPTRHCGTASATAAEGSRASTIVKRWPTSCLTRSGLQPAAPSRPESTVVVADDRQRRCGDRHLTEYLRDLGKEHHRIERRRIGRNYDGGSRRNGIAAEKAEHP